MSDYSLEYEITIRGRIPLDSKNEQLDCINAAHQMHISIPAVSTRTGATIRLTTIESGTCIIYEK